MLLSGSTLQKHYKFDFDLYSNRVSFVISWPILFIQLLHRIKALLFYDEEGPVSYE